MGMTNHLDRMEVRDWNSYDGGTFAYIVGVKMGCRWKKFEVY